MQPLKDDIDYWNNYAWPEAGEEWSLPWGSTDLLWAGTLLPRIISFVPTGTILEIAPGFGRVTHYLKGLCRQLILVDFSERCIAECRKRFADCSHIQYFVNDGLTLPMVSDQSVDFVFSFDSLVHAEAATMRSYLQELARILSRDGVGFLHHSNLGHFVDPTTGELRVEPVHGRAREMTAERFEQFATEAGLQCISQEIINWGGEALIDCFSLFTPRNSKLATNNLVVANRQFVAEVARLSALSRLYVPRHIKDERRFDGCYRVIPDNTLEKWLLF